jgi:hypothetical protein
MAKFTIEQRARLEEARARQRETRARIVALGRQPGATGGTFDRVPGQPDRCVNCGRAEREHTWRCDGCGEALERQPFELRPILHVSAFPELHPERSGATLFCDHLTSN